MELTDKERKAAQAFARLGGLKGGKARAEAMTPEERRANAREAANARWAKVNGALPRETHTGILQLGDREIPCSVLDNELRVLSISGLSRAMGSRKKGINIRVEDRDIGSPQLPPFLYAANIKPFIPDDLMASLTSPTRYKMLSGGNALGIKAVLLPDICKVIIEANNAGVLSARQQYLVNTAEILRDGFQVIGIIGLIDEVTGYQEVRDRRALQEILDKFLLKQFAAWAQRFPDEFYRHIFRLRGWEWRGMKVNRPQIVASYTKDFVYSRLAPGILTELEKRNPKDEHGYRKARHHQFFTDDIGHPALAQHLHAVVALMRASKTWKQFQEMIDSAFPQLGDTLQLPLFKDDEFPVN
jgi:hypothetical protein